MIAFGRAGATPRAALVLLAALACSNHRDVRGATFAPGFAYLTPGGAGLVTTADLDGDGRTEVLLGSEGGRDDLAVYRVCSP